MPPSCLDMKITLAFERYVILDAQEQWQGSISVKINLLLRKLQVWCMTYPVGNVSCVVTIGH